MAITLLLAARAAIVQKEELLMQQDQNVKKTRGNASKFELCALYMTYELFASLFFLGMWRMWEDTGNFYHD